jgi:hypothetical protein
MAPAAQRDLASEIDDAALTVYQVWSPRLVRAPDGEDRPEVTVVAWVDPGLRGDVAAWLRGDGDAAQPPPVRTDWLLFPSAPEAVLIGAVEGEQPFRFNLRLSADRYRRQRQALAGAGQLGLTIGPLQVGPARALLSGCRFVPIQTRPLRDFLRELPPLPVV